MKEQTILVLPAEGDSAETEAIYIRHLKQHYETAGLKLNVVCPAGKYEMRSEDCLNCNVSTIISNLHDAHNVEVHAQAGLGTALAWAMSNLHPELFRRIFFIGGAPACTMDWQQKFIHHFILPACYYLHIPYFADDPNPFNNPEIDAIKKSSTEVMRSNPRIFKDQIKFISNWDIGNWTADRNNIDYFYVPNGRSKRPEWWDNSFNRAKAVEFWYRHGVPNTTIPDNYFSVYSMMPAESLFAVMDKVRTF